MTLVQNLIGRVVLMRLGELSLPKLKREEGQTLVEYALILALISIAIIAAATLLSGKIQSVFDSIGSSL